MTVANDNFFLPYQAKWIKDQSRIKVMEKSRQIGISWATAYALVRRKSRERRDAWVSSRDDLQARLFKEDCNHFAGVLHAAAQDLGQQVIDTERGISAFVLGFASGSRIHSMSSNPDAQAGKVGDRELDEFALHPDPRKLYGIAYPGITWGGKLEIISTHRGSANFFNQIIQEVRYKGNKKHISLHRVTLQDALDQGFLKKLKTKLADDDERKWMDEAAYFDFTRSGCPDEETFQQEFMCNPSDDNSAFLGYDLIQSCQYGPTENWMLDLLDCKGRLFVGVDIGRDHDLTVIWVLEKIGDVFYTRRVIEMSKETFDAQESALYEILKLQQVARCCIDQTGMGRQFAERASQRFGFRVEGVQFTGPVKEELAYPLKAAFEDRTVRIPDNPKILADLRAIKKTTTASGNIRFEADRGKNGHSDRFWGLALALHAAGKNVTPGKIVAYPRRWRISNSRFRTMDVYGR